MHPLITPNAIWIEKRDGSEHGISLIEDPGHITTLSPPVHELFAADDWTEDFLARPEEPPVAQSWTGKLADFMEQFEPADLAAV